MGNLIKLGKVTFEDVNIGDTVSLTDAKNPANANPLKFIVKTIIPFLNENGDTVAAFEVHTGLDTSDPAFNSIMFIPFFPTEDDAMNIAEKEQSYDVENWNPSEEEVDLLFQFMTVDSTLVEPIDNPKNYTQGEAEVWVEI